MNEIIKKYNVGYTQVLNVMLYDKRLSLRAKGVYAYLFSKPDGWNFHINAMGKELKESKGQIYSAIKELIDNGYIIRRQENNNGVFGGIVYVFLNPVQENRNTETPCTENTVYGSTPSLNNTDKDNNTYKESNTDINISKKGTMMDGKRYSFDVKDIVVELGYILSKYYGRDFQMKNWAQHIDKMLKVDLIPVNNIHGLLEWYDKHIGEPFVPVIESARSLREKYAKLESAHKRFRLEQLEKEQTQQEDVIPW